MNQKILEAKKILAHIFREMNEKKREELREEMREEMKSLR